MKNVHIVPTDKLSRVYNDFQNQNIYITNDEEIKVGDWYLDTFNTQRIKANEFSDHKHYGNACKKIILTTDQDLIGVQAIDDEFIEWFVNNPSCEAIDVKKQELNTDYRSDWEQKFYYKIIIPKEEGAKWQQEKMYSEEEFKKAVIDSVNDTIDAYNYYTESPHNPPPMNGEDYYNLKF